MLDPKHIDLTITLISCNTKGYTYVGEIIYKKMETEIIELLQSEGYKLGKAAYDDEPGYYGLYRPLKDKK